MKCKLQAFVRHAQTVEGPALAPERAKGRLHQARLLLLVSSYVPRLLRVIRKAATATMAITPTMGSTVARATLPPWLRPEPLLEEGEDWVWAVEDCVWGTASGAGGVAAAQRMGHKRCCQASV